MSSMGVAMFCRVLGPLTLLGAVAVIGCQSTEPSTRPPAEPVVYRTAPDEPTYNRPLEYPKEYMEQDPLTKKAKSAGLPGLTRPGQGGRPSMGGGPGF